MFGHHRRFRPRFVNTSDLSRDETPNLILFQPNGLTLGNGPDSSPDRCQE